MTYYAVIDTNVLVSALISGNETSATVDILKKLISGSIIPVYSKEIMEEYSEVLNRKKFGFAKKDTDYLLSTISAYGVLTNPLPTDIILPDKKDLPFYEAAAQHFSAYLITGNLKHFPGKPFIVSARQMIILINTGHSVDF